MLRLIITKKGDSYQEELAFDDSQVEVSGIITIGRAQTNDVLLDDSADEVSRHHAALVRLPGPPGGYFIRDLSSRNSTWVGEQATCAKRLSNGDVVDIGEYSLRYCFQEGGTADQWDPDGDLPIVVDEGKAGRKTTLAGQRALPTRLGGRQSENTERSGKTRREETLEELLRKAQMTSAEGSLFKEFIGPILHGVEADRGFIALFNRVSGDCHCVARQLGRNEKIKIGDSDYLETLRKGLRIAEGRVLLVPFHRDGEVVGFFCVNRKPPKPSFALEDGDFLENLGSQLIMHLLKRAKRRVGKGQDAGEVVDERLDWGLELVGRSASTKTVLRQIQEAVEQKANVLIMGETGTGKELVARAIHHSSSRSEGPLVAINCAAIPENLLENELFGHEKGAFTDAKEQRRGLFEQANKGILFLDEVGEMSLVAQVRLLRVLEEHKITRIGGTTAVAVDVRVVAATNKDLKEAVAQGTFRRDLYHRLNGLELKLPPLRERREDIPLLVHFFIDRFASMEGRKTRWISRLAMQQLLSHDWPGNVRELRNLLASAVSDDRGVIFSWDLFREQEPAPLAEMAPVRAEDIAPAVPADIYSFGIVLYEMLTGQVPFAGQSREEYAQIHQKYALPMVPAFRSQPVPLRALVKTCLAKDPDERYASFAEVRDALAGPGHLAGCPGPPPRGRVLF